MAESYFDYIFGLYEIIPSGNRPSSPAAKSFFKLIAKALKDVDNYKIFPTNKLVFVFVLQFFAEEKEYLDRDVDNMCKTLFAALSNRLVKDDSQIKTLLISKQLDKRIPDDYFYVGLKVVSEEDDTGMVKVNKKSAITLYKSQLALKKEANK